VLAGAGGETMKRYSMKTELFFVASDKVEASKKMEKIIQSMNIPNNCVYFVELTERYSIEGNGE